MLFPYHAAPATDKPMHAAIPIFAHVYGDTVSRNCPTWEPNVSIARGNGSRPAAHIKHFTLAMKEKVYTTQSTQTRFGRRNITLTSSDNPKSRGRKAGGIYQPHGWLPLTIKSRIRGFRRTRAQTLALRGQQFAVVMLFLCRHHQSTMDCRLQSWIRLSAKAAPVAWLNQSRNKNLLD